MKIIQIDVLKMLEILQEIGDELDLLEIGFSDVVESPQPDEQMFIDLKTQLLSYIIAHGALLQKKFDIPYDEFIQILSKDFCYLVRQYAARDISCKNYFQVITLTDEDDNYPPPRYA